MAAGALLALVTRAVDDSLGTRQELPLTLSMSANAATWLLSTVAGAMITTAGVVFSLTVVSLQLASSQFSPRVMRSFIRDRGSQLVIGLLVATFVYCVLILPGISGEATDPAPQISLTVALLLTLLTVVAIVAHLDHLARRLQVGHVVESIAAEGLGVIRTLEHQAARERIGDEDELTTPPKDAVVVTTGASGWVCQVASEQLLTAVPAGTTVRLETRVGAYLHAGEALVTVWPAPGRERQDMERGLRATITIGVTRTMQEDVDFAIRQLVDVGLRALSSAINDPSTAVEVTLRLGSLLRELLIAVPLARTAHGQDGRKLLRPWELDDSEYVAHAFDQLRQAAPPQPQVAAALLRVLRMLIDHLQHAGRTEALPALRAQRTLLIAAVAERSELQEQDRQHLLALAEDSTDPADHSRG